jgi:hypothetical protein
LWPPFHIPNNWRIGRGTPKLHFTDQPLPSPRPTVSTTPSSYKMALRLHLFASCSFLLSPPLLAPNHVVSKLQHPPLCFFIAYPTQPPRCPKSKPVSIPVILFLFCPTSSKVFLTGVVTRPDSSENFCHRRPWSTMDREPKPTTGPRVQVPVPPGISI